VLEIRDLRTGYGMGEAIHAVSLDARAGAITAVLGRVGAGKTTLLQAVTGFLPVRAGTISFRGESIAGWAPERIARLGVGYVPQEGEVFARLTVDENLRIAAYLAKQPPVFDEVFELFPVLAQRGKQVAGSLSGGERKMLGVARALVAKPGLMILDEPTEGVWPAVIEQISHALAALKGQIGILLAETHLDLALELADDVYVLDRGALILDGAPAEVRSDSRLEKALVA
jgi:ABC-type branched-subunit amino acid transport system ATPase component